MSLRFTSFFFKKGVPGVAPGPTQIAIPKSEVETPGLATQSNIIALYQLSGTRGITDVNSYGLYAGSVGTIPSPVYALHTGVLSDYGYGQYIVDRGIHIFPWATGTLDTYYNTTGVTLSWIQRLVPVANARLMEYWQADDEHISLRCVSTTVTRLQAQLGSGTNVYIDFTNSTYGIDDGLWHHYLVHFHPGGDRIARCYIDGSLVAETAAVSGTGVFGDVATNIRRGISFGCVYSGATTNVSGNIDHCVILRGKFTPHEKFFANKMALNGDFTKYYGDQMTYNPT